MRFSTGDLFRCVTLLSAAFGCISVAALNPYSEAALVVFLTLPLLGAGIGALHQQIVPGMAWGTVAMAGVLAILILIGVLFPAELRT